MRAHVIIYIQIHLSFVPKNWKILAFLQPPKGSIQGGVVSGDPSMLGFPLRVLLRFPFLQLSSATWKRVFIQNLFFIKARFVPALSLTCPGPPVGWQHWEESCCFGDPSIGPFTFCLVWEIFFAFSVLRTQGPPGMRPELLPVLPLQPHN